MNWRSSAANRTPRPRRRTRRRWRLPPRRNCCRFVRSGRRRNCRPLATFWPWTTRRARRQFLVHEGWRTIVELDGEGRIVDRHTLDLPEMAAVSQLQSDRGRDASSDTTSPGRYATSKPTCSIPAGAACSAIRRRPSSTTASRTRCWRTSTRTERWNCVSASGVLPVSTAYPSTEVPYGPMTRSRTFSRWPWSAASPSLGNSGSRRPVVRSSPWTRGASRSPSYEQPDRWSTTFLSAPPSRPRSTPYCGIAYGSDGRRLAVGLNAEPQVPLEVQPARRFVFQSHPVRDGRVAVRYPGKPVADRRT